MKLVTLIVFMLFVFVDTQPIAGQAQQLKNDNDQSFVQNQFTGHSSYQNRNFNFALRSNLLSTTALTPTIGIEVPIGKHFSVAADFVYTYWIMSDRYTVQTTQVSAEGRYWFDWKGIPLTGFSMGAHITYGGEYDVQWQKGWQGDSFWTFGVMGGYSYTISRRVFLDFSLAMGYFFTPEARHYHRPQKGHLIWQETRYNMGRFAPTKARIGLVWLININKKRSK